MRRYSDPVEVRSGSRLGAVQGAAPGREAVDAGEPDAFIWQGRLYVVRRVLAHWRERRSWWRDALDPVPGQPTGIDVASREQHVWRVEASQGQAFGTGVFDLPSDGAEGADADWRLVRVAD
jgi:Domain of unknown function (DUF6504)